MKKYFKVTISGKSYTTSAGDTIEIQMITDVANITITDIGSENLYFTLLDDTGTTRNAFCKCL